MPAEGVHAPLARTCWRQCSGTSTAIAVRAAAPSLVQGHILGRWSVCEVAAEPETSSRRYHRKPNVRAARPCLIWL